MRTVNFQGTALTPGQRRILEQQHHVRSLMKPALKEQVAQTLAVLEARKEQGVKSERIWTLERQETGTTCVAEWMGF